MKLLLVKIKKLLNAFDSLVTRLEQLENTRPSPSDENVYRNNVGEIQSSLRSFDTSIAETLTDLNSIRFGLLESALDARAILEYQENLARRFTEVEAALDERIQQASIANEKFLEKFEKLEVAQKILTDTPISSHFEEQDEKHRIGATLWLSVTGVLCAILIGIVVFLSHSIFFDDTYLAELASLKISQIMYLGLAKLLLISAIAVPLGVAIKNYNAHRHQQVLARFRSNILRTFEHMFSKMEVDKARLMPLLVLAFQTVSNAKATVYITKTDV